MALRSETEPIRWAAFTVPGDPELAAGRTGAGPDPVVAMHGITSHHRWFGMIARHLRRPDGMAALDLRGRGDSGKPASGYGFPTHAADVVRLLDQLGIGRALLVGHSMGAFVAEEVALTAPERVRGLVLLDGGWARPDDRPAGDSGGSARPGDSGGSARPAGGPAAPDGGPAEDGGWGDADLQAGLARAFRRLEMTFPTQDAYLDFWFPGQGLTMAQLPPDLADCYRYDLAEAEGGWRPKAALAAALEDAAWGATRGRTAGELARIGCPVALVRAAEGFFPGAPPLVGDERRRELGRVLDLRTDLLLSGANHYTMLYGAHAARIAEVIDQMAADTA